MPSATQNAVDRARAEGLFLLFEEPYDPDRRYRIYAVTDTERSELAGAPCKESMGMALGTLDEDAEGEGEYLYEQGRIGVLDTLKHRWIVHPWPRGLGR